MRKWGCGSVSLVGVLLLMACGQQSQPDVRANYMSTVLPDFTAYTSLVHAASEDSTCIGFRLTSNPTPCRSYLAQSRSDLQKLQNDLNGLQAPQCLAGYDSQLRTALSQHLQGLDQAINMLDAPGGLTDIFKFNDLAGQGSDALNTAMFYIQQQSGC